MTQIIPLTKIGFFNPGRLTDEEIEQSFVARIPFFEFIFKKIISEKPDSIPQHHLIIGERGMGKTSLLTRIAAELRKPPYKNSFIPLSFPEEQYNVDRLSKFWLNCLDALADALDKELKSAELAALDAEIRSLSKQKNVDANAVYRTFENWVSKIKRRPVLLVDNLNQIFLKINTEEQHQLRAILMSVGAPVLVGASATAIDETLNYQAPFYDAFQINYLKKLSFRESIEVLLNLAKITGNSGFANNIYLERGRIEALYQLTGGTPRTLALLFPLIQNGFSEDIQTDLDALLDVITPLYKARFEELSQQLQVVLDAVALHWDPVNIEQLRDITSLENPQLSPQLKRLVDVGWLQKLEAYKAKGGVYEVNERFFNIWYLMRRSSRRQKRELYCLTKFLESFYGANLQEIAKARIECETGSTNQIALDLALADAIKEEELSKKLKDKSYEAIIDLSLNDGNILKRFSVPSTITDKKINDLFQEVRTLWENKDYSNAELTIQKIIRIDENHKDAWSVLGLLYTDYLGRYEEAEQVLKKAVTLDETSTDLWNNLGILYKNYLGRYEEAEQAFKKAIALDETSAYPWNSLGILYKNHLGRYDEAEQAFKKAIELDETLDYPWNNLGALYLLHLDRYDEAEQAFKKAIELDETSAYPWDNLGSLYVLRLGRYEEAEQAFKKAIALDETSASPWNGLGFLYRVRLGKYEEAEQAFKKAIALDETSAYPWDNLGDLYLFYLGRYDEAEQAFKKAIELDETFASPWSGLGRLYMNYLGRYEEAEQAFKKAIVLDEKNISYWNSLGNLCQDFLHNYTEAENSYQKALSIDADFTYAKYNLVFLLRDKLNQPKKAEAMFSTIIKSDELEDSYLLNKALFSYYERNVGIAEGFLREALLSVRDTLPSNTIDDWYRSAAVSIKLGYAGSWLQVFSDTGYDIMFKPFYVAVEAITKKEGELFFNSIAAELREPAKKIMSLIKNYMM